MPKLKRLASSSDDEEAVCLPHADNVSQKHPRTDKKDNADMRSENEDYNDNEDDDAILLAVQEQNSPRSPPPPQHHTHHQPTSEPDASAALILVDEVVSGSDEADDDSPGVLLPPLQHRRPPAATSAPAPAPAASAHTSSLRPPAPSSSSSSLPHPPSKPTTLRPAALTTTGLLSSVSAKPHVAASQHYEDGCVRVCSVYPDQTSAMVESCSEAQIAFTPLGDDLGGDGAASQLVTVKLQNPRTFAMAIDCSAFNKYVGAGGSSSGKRTAEAGPSNGGGAGGSGGGGSGADFLSAAAPTPRSRQATLTFERVRDQYRVHMIISVGHLSDVIRQRGRDILDTEWSLVYHGGRQKLYIVFRLPHENTSEKFELRLLEGSPSICSFGKELEVHRMLTHMPRAFLRTFFIGSDCNMDDMVTFSLAEPKRMHTRLDALLSRPNTSIGDIAAAEWEALGPYEAHVVVRSHALPSSGSLSMPQSKHVRLYSHVLPPPAGFQADTAGPHIEFQTNAMDAIQGGRVEGGPPMSSHEEQDDDEMEDWLRRLAATGTFCVSDFTVRANVLKQVLSRLDLPLISLGLVRNQGQPVMLMLYHSFGSSTQYVRACIMLVDPSILNPE